MQSAEGGADYRHRIFTMGGEIPFAGHPSLGAAVAVARARGESRVTYVQQTQPGEQAIDVELDGLRASVSMLQEPPEFGPELDPDEVLGLVGPRRLRGRSRRCRARSSPPASPQVIGLRPRRRRAAAACCPPTTASGGCWPSTTRSCSTSPRVDPEAGTARARSFMRSAEMGEDPATGSAVGPLCAHVAARTGAQRIEIDQGVEMGRPSRLVAEVDGDRVRVGGDAVVLAEGTVHLLDT